MLFLAFLITFLQQLDITIHNVMNESALSHANTANRRQTMAFVRQHGQLGDMHAWPLQSCVFGSESELKADDPAAGVQNESEPKINRPYTCMQARTRQSGYFYVNYHGPPTLT